MGNKTQTSTSQSSTTPTNLAGLQAIFDKVQGAASTPYTPYGGQLTAGINQQQQTGINNVNAAAGSAQPYYNTAAGYGTQAGAAIDPSQIDRYLNPYTQSVINATQANFNESNGQQQQQVKGNAALAGALGGDRQAVAQAETARQQKLAQDPVIANLNQQNYTQALNAAQADRSAAGNAAGIYGNLGTAAQTAALQGAGAQINAGTLQQQTDQAGLNAQYQQYLQQQAFPYAQAQFYSQYGTPAALSQGSSTSGTQTAPGPNMWSQLLGLGTAAATAYSDERVKENIEQVGKLYDGQPIYKFNYTGSPMTQIGLMAQKVEGKHPFAVGDDNGIKTVDYDLATEDAARKGRFADGGAVSPVSGGESPFNFIGNGVSFIPKGAGAPSGQLNSPALQFAKTADDGTGKGLGQFAGAAAKAFGNSGTPDYGQTSNMDVGGYSMPQFGNSVGVGDYQMPTIGFNSGGLVEAIHSIHRGIKKARGGAVMTSPFQGYANGGATFDERFSSAFPMQQPAQEEEPFRLSPPEALDAWRASVDQPNPAVVADGPPLAGPSEPSAPAPANPMVRPSLPPQITNPDNAPEQPDSMPETAMAYDGSNPMRSSSGASPSAAASAAVPESRFGSFNPFGLSDKAREAIIVGALGTASSRSPFALSAIGEGGLAGMGAYSAASRAEAEAADKKIAQQQNQIRIDQEARRIENQVSQNARDLGLRERSQAATERYQKGQLDRSKFRYLGPAEDGSGSVVLDESTGEPKVIPSKVAPKGGAKPLPSTTVKQLTEAGSTFADFDRLVTTFKPDYAGKTLGAVGDMQNTIGRNVGAGYGEQAQWWQDYQTQKNEIRHKLFGSALTATEKGEFDRAAITPGMTKETVEANLGRQRMIAQRAARKLAQTYSKMGYSRDAIEAAVGVPIEALEQDGSVGGKDAAAGFKDAPRGMEFPTAPKDVPGGSAWNPARRQWMAPNGSRFDEAGKPIR